MSGDVFLTTVGGPVHTSDFENALEKLFTDFCEWLDQLDQEFFSIFQEGWQAKEYPDSLLVSPSLPWLFQFQTLVMLGLVSLTTCTYQCAASPESW